MLDKVNAFLNNEKMTVDTILEVLQSVARFDVEDGPYRKDTVKVDDTSLDAIEIYDAIYRRFDLVDSFGGEGLGDTGWLIFKDKETAQHYRFQFDYQSYHGFYYEYGTWCKVVPKQVTVTEYNYQK